jgi:hypothetical protein
LAVAVGTAAVDIAAVVVAVAVAAGSSAVARGIGAYAVVAAIFAGEVDLDSGIAAALAFAFAGIAVEAGIAVVAAVEDGVAFAAFELMLGLFLRLLFGAFMRALIYIITPT